MLGSWVRFPTSALHAWPTTCRTQLGKSLSAPNLVLAHFPDLCYILHVRRIIFLPTEGVMNIRWLLSVALVLAGTAHLSAQTKWQFRWQKGEVLTYKVK